MDGCFPDNPPLATFWDLLFSHSEASISYHVYNTYELAGSPITIENSVLAMIMFRTLNPLLSGLVAQLVMRRFLLSYAFAKR